MNNTTSLSVEYNFGTVVSQISIYIYPITMALVVLTNTLNIAVLSRRSLRSSSSCTHYFLALSIDSLVYLIFTRLGAFLISRFQISIIFTPFGCRIQQFWIYSTGLFFTTMLVYASIDRFCASSSLVRLRNFSNVRVAQRVIIIITISLTIYMSPFFLISHWNYTTNKCSQYSTTLTVVYLSSRVIIYYIIEPLAMIIFGLLTIRNIRKQTHLVAPTAPQNNHRRTVGQLTRVLIIQVGIHLFFSIPTAVTYIITTFLPWINPPLVTGFRQISIIWQQAIFFLSFFSYILSSNVFRIELLKMFKLNNRHNQTVHPSNHVRRRFSTNKIADTPV